MFAPCTLPSRMQMKAKVSKVSSLTTTALGSRVACLDKDLLLEEAPQAYKVHTCAAGLVAVRVTLALSATCAGCQDVDAVVADLVAARLVSVVAVLRPVVTYKG